MRSCLSIKSLPPIYQWTDDTTYMQNTVWHQSLCLAYKPLRVFKFTTPSPSLTALSSQCSLSCLFGRVVKWPSFNHFDVNHDLG